jgi:hypothetical protein
LYDNFGEAVPKEEARKKYHLPQTKRSFYFLALSGNTKGLMFYLKP